MTDKQIIIDGIDVSGCEYFSSGLGYCTIGLLANDGTHICECEQNCHYKQLKRKEQEYEELRQYHNKCYEENAKKLKECLEKYNQVSRDFYNGKYCNKENCSLLKAKEQECEEMKKQRQSDKGLITSTGKMNYQLLQEYDKNRTYIQQVQAENGYFRNKSEKSEDLIKKIIDFVQKEIEYFNHDEEYQCDWKELLKIIESEGYDVRRKKESKRKIIKGSPRG